MATQIDINPFPLGALAPTSGTPLSVLTNFADIVQTTAKVLTFYAPAANTGDVYVGRETLNRSTYVGVLLVVVPGETKSLPYNIENANMLMLNKIFIDVDTTGDKAVVSALFA